jgi:2-polyprenyl-3-methyl-5-hydroxy-6-metoxy-1,4-benzoquinol methylase
MSCPVCGGSQVAVQSWISRCRSCGFLTSSLKPGASSADSEQVTAGEFEAGIGSLRRRGFALTIAALKRNGAGPTLLDVGCHRGMMIALASEAGFDASGIEPEQATAEEAQRAGLEVTHGFFPNDLPAGRYDVITFNDVFEHLPDVNAAMAACKTRLNPGGLLAIALPNSEGLLYRVASMLAAVGVNGPLRRAWQAGCGSPHISYFNPDQLASLARRHGFSELERIDLPGMQLRGLWTRVRFDKAKSLAAALVEYLGMLALYPTSKALPSDATLQLFKAPP